MTILFLRPRPDPETIGLQHVMLVEPLELEILAALVSAPHVPVIADLIIEKRPLSYHLKKEKPGLVCVTGYITNIPAMIDHCRQAKQFNPSVITIAGGVHCEVCPGDLDSEHIDYRVVRNATRAFPQLLEHITQNGSLPPGVLRKGEKPVTGSLPPYDFFMPLPARHLTRKYRKKYFYIFHDKVALIKTAFGCPYACNFCFCRRITSGRYHARPLPEIIAELRTIDENEIYIVDDDFLCSPSRVKQFIALCRTGGINKHYLLYGRADFIANNRQVMRDFRDIGLKTVIVGFESFFDEELRSYAKQTDSETNTAAMRILNELGIDCFATVILPPHWSEREFAVLKETVLQLGIHYINLQPLTPLPGTGWPVEDKQLLISRTDYPKWDLAHVSIRPQQLSVREYYRQIIKLYMVILFQKGVLRDYLKAYSPRMLWKMLRGSYLVRRQYLRKMKKTQ